MLGVRSGSSRASWRVLVNACAPCMGRMLVGRLATTFKTLRIRKGEVANGGPRD